MSDSTRDTEPFVRALTEHQVQLEGFITASIGDYTHAADVLQRTNTILWRKSNELRSVDEFLPWAITIAKYEILAFVRDQRRDRLVFCPQVIDAMLETAEKRVEQVPMRQEALRVCLQQLSRRAIELLGLRYAAENSIGEIARASNRSVDSVKSQLKRIRRSLADCVESRIVGLKSHI